MNSIYLGSCHELIEQRIIDGVCDFFINRFNIKNGGLHFISTQGNEPVDVMCLNYIDKNHYSRELYRPLEQSKPSIMQKCEYAIVFNSHRKTDFGHANGVDFTLGSLATNIKRKVIEVHLNLNSISVYDCKNGRRLEYLRPEEFFYEFDENGSIIIETMLEKMKRMGKLYGK